MSPRLYRKEYLAPLLRRARGPGPRPGDKCRCRSSIERMLRDQVPGRITPIGRCGRIVGSSRPPPVRRRRAVQTVAGGMSMDSKTVARWCDTRREAYAAGDPWPWIEIEDPYRLRSTEREAITSQCARFNLALYRFARGKTDTDALSAFASAMGLERRDRTLGADDRGIARVQVVPHTRWAEMIPFTARALNWHTDGYYNAPNQSVRGVVMHCAHPAASGGENALLDPDLVLRGDARAGPGAGRGARPSVRDDHPRARSRRSAGAARPHRTCLPFPGRSSEDCTCATRCAPGRYGGVRPRIPPAPSPRSKRRSPRSRRIMCRCGSRRAKA